jgi:hypothetical protein
VGETCAGLKSGATAAEQLPDVLPLATVRPRAASRWTPSRSVGRPWPRAYPANADVLTSTTNDVKTVVPAGAGVGKI